MQRHVFRLEAVLYSHYWCIINWRQGTDDSILYTTLLSPLVLGLAYVRDRMIRCCSYVLMHELHMRILR